MAVRSGWCIAHAASPWVPVEYSCRAFRKDFCSACASSIVRLSRTWQTSASVRTVRGIAGNGDRLDSCDKEAWEKLRGTESYAEKTIKSNTNLVLVYANIVSAFHEIAECDRRLTCAKKCSVIFIDAQIDRRRGELCSIRSLAACRSLALS